MLSEIPQDWIDAAADVVCTIFGQPGATHDPTFGLAEGQQIEAIRLSAQRLRELVDTERTGK